jgi:hypothetical protein
MSTMLTTNNDAQAASRATHGIKHQRDVRNLIGVIPSKPNPSEAPLWLS